MLKFLSYIYLLVVKVRNFMYDYALLLTYKSELPVICIGNLTVGGNGKTPLVEYLVKELIAKNKKPVILSRGYGGKCVGPYLLQEGDSPEFVGDEPLLLFESTKAPVVIARDRYLGAKLIESQQLGDLIIMDDGLQHRRLQRDLNLVCYDVGTEAAIQQALDEDLLPAGRYREPIESALKRIDAIFFNSRGKQVEVASYQGLVDRFSDKQVFHSYLKFDCLQELNTKSQLSKERVICLTSIAKPEGFKEFLETQNLEVVDSFNFADHYHFTQEDIDQIREKYSNLPIICTVKDAVKLKALKVEDIYVCQVKLVLNNDLNSLLKY